MWIEIESAVAVTLLAVASQAQAQPPSPPSSQPASRPARQHARQHASQAATEPPSREQLARLLVESHGAGTKPPEMVAFDATLRVANKGRNQDNIEFTIATSFRKDVPRGSRRPLDMIRYSVDEGGKRLERGRDAYGYWFRKDGKVTSLDDRHGATDRALVKREIRLAKQLLSVVDPAAILGRLEGRVTVAEGRPPVGTKTESKAGYWVATGILQDYPFYTLPQDRNRKPLRARVSLYVNKSTGMLRAVQATHPPTRSRELVLFDEYGECPLAGTDRSTVRLPTTLKIARARGDGKYEPVVRITIPSVALNPKLTAADFQRSRRRPR